MGCDCTGFTLLHYGHQCSLFSKKAADDKLEIVFLTRETLERIRGRIRFRSDIFHSEYHATQQAINTMIQSGVQRVR